MQGGNSTSGSGSGSGFGGELSHDIGAAISSPAPVSPAMTLDFEPPRDTRERADEPERDSPMGSTDMHPGSNSNSSLSDYNKVSTASVRAPLSVVVFERRPGFGMTLKSLVFLPHLNHPGDYHQHTD